MDEEIELIDDQTTELEQLRKLHKLNLENKKEEKEVPKVEEQNEKTQEVQIEKVEVKEVKSKKEKTKKSKRRLGIRLILLSILLIPLFAYLYIISLHSNRLINETLSIVMLVLALLSVFILVAGICITATNKKTKADKKLKVWVKAIMGTFFTGYVTVSTIVMVLLYGPSAGFRDWLVTTAMMTMNHQYLAEWFYDDITINGILKSNTVVESGEDTNPDLIDISGGTVEQTFYANKYEEEILKKDEGNDLYKIIDIKHKNFKGKMAVIYDPSKVKLAVSKGTGNELTSSYGQMITTMSKDNNAIIAMNAGGFYDPNWNSSGGVPHGVVISNGKLIANNKRAVSVGGIIGFNKENKLVLAKMSAQEALNQGLRDAVDFGPFLIVNGKSSFINGNGGWGVSPRSAIAQRKDGIVLFLVIDGRQASSPGADMDDLVEVLLNYGAYNAANLDGGTSSAMSYNHKIITNPRNGNFQAKTRAVPNAWIVVK